MKGLTIIIKSAARIIAMVILSAVCPFSLHAEKTIPIAMVGPMSGEFAPFGGQMKNGAQMAVADINAAGGVLGRQVTLQIVDDACDPDTGVMMANRLVATGVVFVVGHWCSVVSIPASKVYEMGGIVQISPGSTNPQLTDSGRANVFRVCGRDEQMGMVAGEFMARKFADARIAILHDNSPYGNMLTKEVRRVLRENGLTEVLFDTLVPGRLNYTDTVAKLKKHEIDVVFYGGYHAEAAMLIRQMRDQGMDTILGGADALTTAEFWPIAGPGARGTFMTFSPDPRKTPVGRRISKRFRAAGIEPEGFTLFAYGAVQAWAQAAQEAGSTDADKVSAVLHRSRFDTVLGQISFNEKGDINGSTYVIYEWKNGVYDYYSGPIKHLRPSQLR
jgi:branched-chain amino acid transport system substrate-binding protein